MKSPLSASVFNSVPPPHCMALRLGCLLVPRDITHANSFSYRRIDLARTAARSSCPPLPRPQSGCCASCCRLNQHMRHRPWGMCTQTCLAVMPATAGIRAAAGQIQLSSTGPCLETQLPACRMARPCLHCPASSSSLASRCNHRLSSSKMKTTIIVHLTWQLSSSQGPSRPEMCWTSEPRPR